MAYPRILIVEDTRQTVDDLRDYFELEGYETEVALNSQVAVSIVVERKMGVALIGMEVHEVHATEIVKELRRIDPSLPIIVLYDSKSKRTEAALAKVGARDFLAKPLVKDVVMRKVKSILEPKVPRLRSKKRPVRPKKGVVVQKAKKISEPKATKPRPKKQPVRSKTVRRRVKKK
jgi:DNA-binding response OmpR family regulator